MSMLVYTGTPARYISIAAPEGREWVPIFLCLKLRQVLLITVEAARSAMRTCFDVMFSSLSWRQTAQTGVSGVVSWYVQIWLTMQAHCSMGQRVASSVCPWMTVLCFWSIFCILKVTATLPTGSNSAEGTGIRCPSLKNLIFHRHKSYSCFSSLLGTIKYLQEQKAKKPAPILSCANAISISVTWCFANLSSRWTERPFVGLIWDRCF